MSRKRGEGGRGVDTRGRSVTVPLEREAEVVAQDGVRVSSEGRGSTTLKKSDRLCDNFGNYQ